MKGGDSGRDGTEAGTSATPPSTSSALPSTSTVVESPSTTTSAVASSSRPRKIVATSAPVGAKSKVGKCFVRCLRRLGNNNSNRHVILETGATCWIGRADDNQLSLPDVVLSRKQAEIKEETDNSWTISDNKSANGTKLNGNWLTPMKPHPLSDKDVIQFGPDEIQDQKCFRYMFHRALKFSRHPSIPSKSIVDEVGVPLSIKRANNEEAAISGAKRVKFQTEGESTSEDRGKKELLAFRKRMQEMEEKIHLQEEEMEEMKKRAAEELTHELAEGEAQLRVKMKEEGEKSKSEIEENLRREIRVKEASHEEEMAKVRGDFERDKDKLEGELRSAAEKEQTTKEELAAKMAEKEKELAVKLEAAARKLEEEKAAMADKMSAELRAKKEEEERKIKEEMEERRRVLIEEQNRLAKEAEEKRRAMEMRLKNGRARVESEKERSEREMKETFEMELKKKRGKIREELDDRKKKLEEERKSVEERLQVEMNKKLEEKDKSLREELIKQRDRISAEIQMRQAKEAQLETEIAVLQMTTEDSETDSKRKILVNLEETMEQELQCAICTELLIEATALDCSHSFCQYCIKEWRKKKNECPVCRKYITAETRALVLDSYIDKMVQHLGDEMKERRKENVKFRDDQKRGKVQPPSSTSGPSATASAVEQPSHVIISSASDDDDDDDVDTEMDSNSSGTISGDEDAPYGGYGSCFICGHRGHWAPGCPQRYY